MLSSQEIQRCEELGICIGCYPKRQSALACECNELHVGLVERNADGVFPCEFCGKPAVWDKLCWFHHKVIENPNQCVNGERELKKLRYRLRV